MGKDTIKTYYSSGIEKTRLSDENFKLEGIRSKEIISRFLQSPPMKILDAGGGTGFYSFWLQTLGHEVTLLDLTQQNIEFANQYSKENNIQLFESITGDATNLPFDANFFDLVLLFGPLYHLTSETSRVKALTEARRVVKSEGVVLSAIISRYASMMDGFNRDLIYDDDFVDILKEDLKSGIHTNPTGNTEYFTTAYFHTPDQIIKEIESSQLYFDKLIAVEGFGWLIKNLKDVSKKELELKKILDLIRSVESNIDLIAASPHIIAVARKQVFVEEN